MIISLINFLSEKINSFRRRNRNQPSYYRLFLFWLTLIILITAIFYILNNLGFENTLSDSSINNVEYSNNPIGLTVKSNMSTMPAPVTGTMQSTNISNIINESKNIEPIASNIVSTVSQQGIYEVPKTELYHEVLNQVGKIPKPLSFVDDFDYKL